MHEFLCIPYSWGTVLVLIEYTLLAYTLSYLHSHLHTVSYQEWLFGGFTRFIRVTQGCYPRDLADQFCGCCYLVSVYLLIDRLERVCSGDVDAPRLTRFLPLVLVVAIGGCYWWLLLV